MWHFGIKLYLIAIVWLCDVHNPGFTGLEFVRAKPNPLLPKKQQSLYTVQDDVIILNSENFKDRIYGKSMVWIIEFYNSWCGHCIKYAPTWKSFASDLKGWRQVVSVGAVDCSDEENRDICREYDIQSYPTIKLFPAGYNPGKDKDKLIELQTQEPALIKKTLVEYLQNAPFTRPPLWPRLSPLTSLGDIWDEVKEEPRFVMVIFEEEDSVVGREVILDVVDFPSLFVRRILRKDVEKFGSFTYPSLYSINRDTSFQLIARGSGLANNDRSAFVEKLLSMLHLKDSEGRLIILDHQQHNSSSVSSAPGINQSNVLGFEHKQLEDEIAETGAAGVNSPQTTKGVHLQDLMSALYYSFRQEVAICKTIEGPKLDVLHNFVTVLAKYFPGDDQVSGFLWKLAEHLGHQDTVLTGDTWLKIIDDLQDKEAVLPDEVLWVGCQGSQPGFRGYPCSMWTLFHTLTVGAYQNTDTAVNAQEVPAAIRGYMKHFFGCQECSMHFGRMAADMEKHVHRPLDAVLWLWNAHNIANRRLHGDISEDPQHPKIQFPAPEDCPKCRSEHNLSSDPYPGWKISAVALFLIKFYEREAIIRDAASEVDMKGRGSEPRELDWWERKQRQDDLQRLKQLREQKKRDRVQKAMRDSQQKPSSSAPFRQRRSGSREPSDIIKESIRTRRLGDGWALNQIDMGVCVMFYMGCAVIILVLYYHFVVNRRFRLPCKGFLAV